MTGKRRANWRAEMDAALSAESEARVATVRNLLNELTDLSRSLTVACQDAAEHRKRIEKLERQNLLWLLFFIVLALPAAVRGAMFVWAVTR